MEVRNRFKGLDLIDRVPDELWNEVRDTVQETEIKTIILEKKCKKTKWLSGEALVSPLLWENGRTPVAYVGGVNSLSWSFIGFPRKPSYSASFLH